MSKLEYMGIRQHQKRFIKVSKKDLKEAFSNYASYIRFLLRCAGDSDYLLPEYTAFDEVFHDCYGDEHIHRYSGGSVLQFIYKDEIQETVYVTRQQYNEAYIAHMVKNYEEDVKNEQCPR